MWGSIWASVAQWSRGYGVGLSCKWCRFEPCWCRMVIVGFVSCNRSTNLMVGQIGHLVFSDKDEKFRRSRVHVAHVKDPLTVGNRKEQAERPLSGQKFQISYQPSFLVWCPQTLFDLQTYCTCFTLNKITGLPSRGRGCTTGQSALSLSNARAK